MKNYFVNHIVLHLGVNVLGICSVHIRVQGDDDTQSVTFRRPYEVGYLYGAERFFSEPIHTFKHHENLLNY